jgi:hypothetical protein
MFEGARSANDTPPSDELIKKRAAPTRASRVAPKKRKRHEKQNRRPK